MVRDVLGYQLCDAPFLFIKQRLPRVVGEILNARGQPGAAVKAPEQLQLGEMVDVAADGLVGDVEMLRQRLHGSKPGVLNLGEELLLPRVEGFHARYFADFAAVVSQWKAICWKTQTDVQHFCPGRMPSARINSWNASRLRSRVRSIGRRRKSIGL